MGNVFKQLVRKEFGSRNYERYCKYIYGEQDQNTRENKMVFEEMYAALKDKDAHVLQEKRKRLDSAILQAFWICRHYSLAAGATTFTILLILLLTPAIEILVIAVGSVLAAFLAKTCEYISNKYCYVDARIILIYKSVLDQLSPGQPEA